MRIFLVLSLVSLQLARYCDKLSCDSNEVPVCIQYEYYAHCYPCKKMYPLCHKCENGSCADKPSGNLSPKSLHPQNQMCGIATCLVCDQHNVQICQQCVETYYLTPTYGCAECVPQCQVCSGPYNCIQCFLGYVYFISIVDSSDTIVCVKGDKGGYMQATGASLNGQPSGVKLTLGPDNQSNDCTTKELTYRKMEACIPQQTNDAIVGQQGNQVQLIALNHNLGSLLILMILVVLQ